MTKKLLIILGGIITISITLVFMKPLAKSIEDLTEAQIGEYTNYSLITTQDAGVFNLNEYILYYTLTADDIAYISNDSSLNYYWEIYEHDFTIDSSKYKATLTSNSFQFRVRILDNVATQRSIYVYFYQYYDLLGLSSDYADYNETLLKQGLKIPFDNILNAIDTVWRDYVYYTETYTIDKIDFTYYIAQTGGTPITDYVTTLSSTEINSFIGYNTYTAPQISGNTATILKIIPFILVSAIVVTTTILIKKEED